MLSKDKATPIRINSELFNKLKEMGLSPQKIIDEKIAELFDITITIEVKNECEDEAA